MKLPMCIVLGRHGIRVTYRCYKVPGRGKNCPDKDTDVCLKCKYSRAEMSGFDATRLLNSYGAKKGDRGEET